MSKKRILFVGAGRMAQAIIAGLVKMDDFDITVSNNGNKERLEMIQTTYGVKSVTDWTASVEHADIVLLAMPPENHSTVLSLLNEKISNQFVITVTAGLGITYLEERLPYGTAVAWVMPNTAAELGKSMTLYAGGSYMSDEHQETLERILAGIGPYQQLLEKQVHDLTPITGSAPAFVYVMAESLIDVAMTSAISNEQAQLLVAQMLEGAAAMLKTGVSPRELADQVATPGGVTAAGLEVLKDRGMNQLVKEAIQACHNRANQN